MLGNGRGRKLKQFGNLTDAQLAARQSHESPDPAFICQGIGYGKHFAHGSSFLFRQITKCTRESRAMSSEFSLPDLMQPC